jgi:hypothetical protein
MHSRPRMFAIAVGVIAALLGGAAQAGASDEVVQPGELIQTAIDDALPGDTVTIAPGEFRENVTITTDDITLRGSGSGRHGTVLMPSLSPATSPCSEPPEVSGICVLGSTDEGGPAVSDVMIEDLTVDGFSGTGIDAFNAEDYTVAHVRARNNGGYGIAGFVLSGVRFLHNVATDNGEPGIYIGDSHNAQAVVIGNASIHNGVGGEGFGFLFRDSSNGRVIDNHAARNCVGFNFIDSGFNEAEPLSDWTAQGNTANNNNGACPASPEFPAFSGTGILLAGTHAVAVTRNHVFSNRPTNASSLSGGIVLASSGSLGGASPAVDVDPTDNIVSRNVAFHNEPADIVWDRTGTGNRFRHNHCARSMPSRICNR